MRTRLHKLHGHAEQVIVQFRQVRATHAALASLASNPVPVARHKAGTPTAAAAEAVKRALLHACIQDLSALCLDDFEQTPSIVRLAGALHDRALVERLRRAHGENVEPPLSALFEAWPRLLKSPSLRALRIARDRVVAHHEVRRVAGRYRACALEDIGVDAAGVGRIIDTLAPVVDALSRVIRGVGFDDDACRAEARRAAAAFWETGPCD